MDTVTGRVASPVALTPDGRLQPGDPAFSFEGRDGVIRHCATSQMPAYQGVKVMLTQDGVPAFMAFMGRLPVLCCGMLCRLCYLSCCAVLRVTCVPWHGTK